MRRLRRCRAKLTAIAVCAVAIPLLAPSAASAHAYLINTAPVASEVVIEPPSVVSLTYDEAVEPRFATISVTNAANVQEATAAPARSLADPDTLIVPLRRKLPEGWYLVYWRVISVDGHPVQGAYTFGVGTSPGTPPDFKVPEIAGSATSLNLLFSKWVMFLSVMTAIGLFVFRLLIARGVVRDAQGSSLEDVSRAFVIVSLIGLVAIPVYLDVATAIDDVRLPLDVPALVPLFGVTAFGRGYLGMTLCFALFCIAGWITLWLDHPERPQRSLVELISLVGALLAAAAVLLVPGVAGHAAQTSPRGVSVALDWMHLTTGSIWLGGLMGVLILWRAHPPGSRVAALAQVVPRFSSVALVSVTLLFGTGVWATFNHLPALDALWKTGYGIAILVKVGLLLAAIVLATGNRLLSVPRLATPATADAATVLLRRLVSGEVLLATAAVAAAAILSSLAPPPPSFVLQNDAAVSVGPGRVSQVLQRYGYTLEVLVSPNQAVAPDAFGLRITRDGKPVRGADVTVSFDATQMLMTQLEYQMNETAPGVYTRSAPALSMAGTWALTYNIAPRDDTPFSVIVLDTPRP